MATENLLVEIGTEELPPKALRTLGEALRDGIVDGLAQRELGHGEVRWFATPRRLAVQIADVQLAAADREQEALGPPLERARDEAGNWTPAAAGFAKKQGVDPADLEHLPRGQVELEAEAAVEDLLQRVAHVAVALGVEAHAVGH